MKHINLTQMLQGCSKRNGMTVSASGSDGAQTSEVKRQTLSSKKEKWSENEALHSTCLRSALVLPSFCSRLDSVSIVSRQSDLRTYVSRIAAILLLVLTVGVGEMWGTAYTPSADEVIVFPTVYNSSKTSAGYSDHSAIAWGGTASTNSKTAGDPNNGGAATSSNVNCFSVKGNGEGKDITVSITGCSKIIVYHESHASRYLRIHDTNSSGTVLKTGSASTYYTELTLTPATSYTLFLEGWSGSQQDFYVYAVKLIKGEVCDKTAPTASWSTAPANGAEGGNMNATLTTNYATGAVYTSSNTSVATVSGNGTTTCAINYVGAGSARITATVTGDGSTYCTGPATCYTDITVTSDLLYAYGFEDSPSAWEGSNTSQRANNSTAKRTGSVGAYAEFSNGDGRLIKGGSIDVVEDETYTMMCWIRMSVAGKAGIGYDGQGGKDFDVSASTWTRVYKEFTAGSSKSGKKLQPTISSSSSGNMYVDDIVMYKGTVDVTAPSSASSASATTSSISWTNGSDANTGLQKTLIWHRTSGSSDDLTLNAQGIYSLTSTIGPSADQSGHWTLLSASVVHDATSYSGTFVEGDRYAIVHRDLAYNYSTPTYVTVESAVSCTAPTGLTNGYGTSSIQAVSWTAGGDETAWEVYLSTSNTTPSSSQTPTATPTNASHIFRDLTGGTTYYWWVRAKCGESSKSDWVAGTSFTTSSATRVFKSGETIFFQDASSNIGTINCLWVVEGGNVYAYFYDETTNNWASGAGVVVLHSHHYGEAVYKFEVPQTTSGENHEWTGVIFTRGTKATWDKNDGYYGQQTSNQTPNVGENMFTISTNNPVDEKYNGSWSVYANGAAIVGDMNEWIPDGGEFNYGASGQMGTLYMNLEANTDYQFKVLDGTGWKGCNATITNTTTSWYNFTGGESSNCTLSTGEAGSYAFKYNNADNTNKWLGVFYPQARLTKNKYIYFDASNLVNWNQANFSTKFVFKPYDNQSNEQYTINSSYSNVLEGHIYYVVVPNDDYQGFVRVDRWATDYSGKRWNYSDDAKAYERTSSKQNCMITKEADKTKWDGLGLEWKTYCPPTTSETFADNSTSVISWTSGTGTSENPYLVPASGTIEVQASALKAVADGNMTINYDFKVDDSSAQPGEGNTYSKGSLSNNTTYKMSVDVYTVYKLDDSKNSTKHTPTALYYKALTTYSVTHSLTGVTRSAGRDGSGAAAYYQPYTATYTASTGYNLPTTITVQFGSTTKTAGTDYTWDQATGIVSIPADKIDGDVTIICSGELKTTAITLDKNGGDTDGSATATYGSGSLTSLTHATRTGYTQNGYETSDHTLIIKADETFEANRDGYTSSKNWANASAAVTLYARWTVNSHTLTWNLAGGTVTTAGTQAPLDATGSPSGSVNYGTTVTAPVVTKAGYTFNAWSPTVVSPMPDEDKTYTATWTPIVPSSVTLNKTSTTITVGGTETLTATISPLVVADNTITWSTSDADVATVDDGVVTAVAAGMATITATTVNGKIATCEVTVAPAVTYTVTYVYNGATGGDDTPSATGASVTLPEPTKTGYTLEGWYTTAGAKVNDGGKTYSPTADITLYARWQSDCAGGGGSTTLFAWAKGTGAEISSDETSLDGSNMGTMSIGTSIVGRTLGSNSIENDANGYKLGNNDVCIEIQGISNFAAGDVVTITGRSNSKNANDYRCFSIAPSTAANARSSDTIQTNKRDNGYSGSDLEYTVAIQSTQAGAKLRIFRLDGKTMHVKAITVTRAGGSGPCYHVYYHGNGAESGFISDPGAYANSATPTVLDYNDGSYALVKEGFEFQGWATSAEGPVAKTAGQTVTISSADVHLYAVWEEEVACSTDPTVTAGSNGSVTSTTATVTCESGISSLGTGGCTITSYGFVIGTSTNPVIGGVGVTQHEVGTSIAASTAFSKNLTGLTKNTTYYVRPYATNSHGTAYGSQTSFTTLVTYTVTYNGNGATSGDAPVDASSPYDAGSNVTVLGNTGELAKTNYTFDGWATANDGTGTSYAAAGTISSIAANTTLYAKWKQTVTLKTGAQGSGADKTPYVYINGATVNGFSAHSAAGYTLQGYYTAGSGGVKVLNADGSFAAANVTDYITSSKWSRTGAAPTLFAQWVATEDCHTLKYAWKVTGKFCDDATSVTASDTVRFPANASNLYFTVSGTGNTVSTGSSYNIGKTQNNYFLLTAKSGYEIKSICFYGKVEDSSVNYTTDNSTWTELTSTNTGGDDYYSFNNINASHFGIKLTAASPKGVWIRNMVIEVCAEGGTTYSVTYDGNDETSGSVPTGATNYSYGTTVTVLGNTGPLAKTNYTFAGWTTNNNGTGSSYEAGSTFSITDNTTLYAKWTQPITFDANTENHGSTGGSATAVWNATGLTGITHAKPASGYKLSGYYTAATDGVKVLDSDGSFADEDIDGYITDGKWSRTGTTTLYAQYEVAGSLTWVLDINTTVTSLTTNNKTSSYTQISTSNMSDATLAGSLTYKGDKKSALTGKISTPESYTAADYVYVTFQVAAGYKFTPSMIQVPVQPVGNGEHKAVELRLTDTNTHSLVSGSATKCDGTEKGKKTTVTLAGDGSYFTGTVTLKIYVYPHDDATATTNKCYRLGTPITIEGEVEATCTMPDYASMSYSQTEYTQGAAASAISVVGASGDPSYQWKYNSTGDRTSGTNCGTEASVTPSTESTGTLYYWCELTNDCGIVKTPSVGITVNAPKSTATVTWTDPSTPNYGGGGYTIRATIDQADWDGTLASSMLTAPEGIKMYNIEIATDEGKPYIEVKFDIQTSFNTTANPSTIPFVLSLPATTDYNALSSEEDVAYNACEDAGEGASYDLKVRKITTKDGNYYYWANTDGWISVNPNSSFSSEKASSKMYDNKFDSVYNTNGQYVYIRTYRANINKVRIYADFRANDMTVSGVYKSTTYFTPGSGSIVDADDYSVVYNEDEEAVNMGESAQKVVDIILDEALDVNDILAVKLSSAKIRPLGAVMTEASSGSLPTSIAWSETVVDDDSNKKNVTTADASFTITAAPTGENRNTLGVVTYASNHPEYASVNTTTGQVTPIAEGTAQITATLAASGCFEKATKTYTVVVTAVSCGEAAGRVTVAEGKTEVCALDPAVLTLTLPDARTNVQWYNDETEISNGDDYTIAFTSGTTTSTLTTSKSGIYWAKAWTSSCTKATAQRSNSITITNRSMAVGASRKVEKWYVKNGRKTPDIALWSLDEGTHLKTVTITRDDEEESAIGLTASDFKELDGVVYLSGKEPSANKTGADVNYTLTLTVEDACGSTTLLSDADKKIQLIHQKNTDKHVLAFVVNGTNKGGFTEGISADQTTNVELYKEIAKNFDVLATNIRATDDEQKLKEYYSQFDILCITDYPNTGDKGANSKSYVDAIGALVDIRPILTMEAWVSSLANWKAKGIVGTPKSPTTRQYAMLLQCKDHEIFSGTDMTKVGEGEDAMYRVKMVDKTIEEYPTLDAYTPGSKDYDAGGKPALQGFTYDASMSSLLPLGRIDDGSGNDLEVGVERQTKMEARLLVLGINKYAMERLEDDGVTIVINALKYLMKKNAEDISDCSNYFTGNSSTDSSDWFDPDNWSNGTLPDKTQEVRILAPCNIAGGIAKVASVKIVTGGEFNHGAGTANGSLVIAKDGALVVDGKIQMVPTAPYYNEVVPTTSDKLRVEASYNIETSDHSTGALIFDNSDHQNEATVEMYTTSHWDWSSGVRKKYWSYVAVPIEEVQVPFNFWNGYTYIFDEQLGWIRKGDWSYIHPFEGVGFSAERGGYDWFFGKLASTESLDITLTKTAGVGEGDNLIGNSWTAPIQIANFVSGDFVNAEATIYIFNTGSQEDAASAGTVVADATNDGAATAGQWLAIPIGVAGDPEYDGLKVIPAMQAYQVVADGTGSLHLDYDRLVRGKDKGGLNGESQLNKPIQAPKRDASRKQQAIESMLRVRVSGTKTRTDVWMMQDNRFSYEFDNGWEAKYVECDNRSAQLYAVSEIGNMAFLAQPELDGTFLGFKPAYGCTEYTFSFNYRGDEKLYLNDLLTETSTLITNESTYTFSSEQQANGNRFLITSQPFGITGSATGIGDVNADKRSDQPKKFIYDDKIYILYHGLIYDANGKLINRK